MFNIRGFCYFELQKLSPQGEEFYQMRCKFENEFSFLEICIFFFSFFTPFWITIRRGTPLHWLCFCQIVTGRLHLYNKSHHDDKKIVTNNQQLRMRVCTDVMPLQTMCGMVVITRLLLRMWVFNTNMVRWKH